MNNFKTSYISQEQEGSGMKGKGSCGCQSGDGLGDLAVKALTFLLPKLFEKLGENAGELISKEGIAFARAKGLLSQNGNGLKAKSKSNSNTGKRLKGEVVQFGIHTKQAESVQQYPTTSQLSEFTVQEGIIPVAKKATIPKKANTKKGGSSNLAGGSSNLAGDGIYLAGQDSFVPKKRGRPVGSGKKKP